MRTQNADDANRNYFVGLANTRASLRRLPALAGLIILVLGIYNVSALNRPDSYAGYKVFSALAVVNFVIIIACVLALTLFMFKGLVYRFQTVSSAVMAAAAAMLVYTLCLLVLMLATLAHARGQEYYVTLFALIGVTTAVLVVVSTAVHVSLLRRRLRAGHSDKRTVGNYLAVSRSNRAKIVWIILGLSVVAPIVLTSGRLLPEVVGGVGLLLFSAVTPSLPVEFAYLAYLKSKDRGYWEPSPQIPRGERVRKIRRLGLWVLGIVVVFGVIWVIGKLT